MVLSTISPLSGKLYLSVDHLGTSKLPTVPQDSRVSWCQTGLGIISNDLVVSMIKFQFLCPNLDTAKFARADVVCRVISFYNSLTFRKGSALKFISWNKLFCPVLL